MKMLLSTKEVAEHLNVSSTTVLRLRANGLLKSIRLGKDQMAPLRFRRADIETFLNQNFIRDEKK